MAKRSNEPPIEPPIELEAEAKIAADSSQPRQSLTDVISERHEFLSRIDREFRPEFVNYALGLCRNYDRAGDLVQDAYRKFLESGWRPQAAKSQPVAAARSYIRRIIRHDFIDEQRARTRHQETHDDMRHRQRADAPAPLPQEFLAALEAVNNLPGDLGETFIMHHVFGHQQTEIAEFLDVSTATVCRRLQRAAELLAARWDVEPA